MGVINVLDIRVANMIAAGEVVERPASCVKELLENAIDSGADDITVEIKRGGVSFIRVTDNGCGMSSEDLPVSIMRHATSKIHCAADLDGIMTLGFRGEALAAIASVSNLRIMSKKKDSRFGSILTAEYGRVVDISEAALRNGTTVIVENLFSNLPARRKFLKKDSSEALAVAAVAEKIAISCPDISLKLIIDGNTKFATPGDGKLISAIHACLGREFASKLLMVKNMTGGVEVLGYICRPEAVRSNRNMQYFYINGRYVKNRTATAALEQAFDSYCESGKFPYCVLFINVHPTLVDVNVHPTKLEVKFSNEKSVFDAVYCAVRNALSDFNSEPGALLEPKKMTPADRSLYNAFVPVCDRFENTPVAHVAKDGLFEYYDADSAREESGADNSSRGAGTASENFERAEGKDAAAENAAPSDSTQDEKIPPGHGASDAVAVTDALTAGATEAGAGRGGDGTIQSAAEFLASLSGKTDAPNKKDERGDIRLRPMSERDNGAVAGDEPREREGTGAHENKISGQPDIEERDARNRHAEEEDATSAGASYTGAAEREEGARAEGPIQGSAKGQSGIPKPYRIIGVAFNAYIMVEYNDTTLIIDKHAAHERIIFEEMKENMKKGRADGGSQMLLLPLEIGLSPEEIAAITEYREQIFAVGYDYEISDGEAVVTSIPAHLSTDQARDMLVTMAGAIASAEGSIEVSREIFYEKALYQASCKAAMKAGIADSDENVQWLVDRLFELTDIRYCPHGRPVAYEISKREMEKFFKRG